jgi:hypothetical protein
MWKWSKTILVSAWGSKRCHHANEGLPHIQGDGLDARQILERKAREATHDAFARPLGSHVDDVSVVEVARDRRVALTLGERLFIEPHVLGNLVRAPGQAPLDRTLQDAVRFVPADVEDARGTENVGLPEDVDGEAFEQQREPRPRLRPRNSYLPDAVLVAADARNLRVQEGLELAAVQVPPGSLFVGSSA